MKKKIIPDPSRTGYIGYGILVQNNLFTYIRLLGVKKFPVLITSRGTVTAICVYQPIKDIIKILKR